MRAIWAISCVLFATVVSIGSVASQDATVLLGEEIANYERETDRFEVKGYRRGFETIQIGVERGTVRLSSLVITFGSGQTREVEPDQVIQPGDRPYIVRFRSRGRKVVRVEATYRTLRRRSQSRALVSLRGTFVERRQEDNVSSRDRAITVDLRDGRATIEVARNSGPARSLQIGVGLRDVFIRHITVTFANGNLKRFDVNSWVDEGKKTPPLTFDGAARRVRQVSIATRPAQSRDIARFLLYVEPTGNDIGNGNSGRVTSRERSETETDNRRFGPVPTLDRDGAPRNHILLGTLDVVLGKPSLELTISRGLGAISSLALRTGRNDVGIGSITATYATGRPDRFQVLRQLAKNSVSPTISLRRPGKLRRIRIKATALTTRPSKLRVYAMLDQDRPRQPRVGDNHGPGKWINLGAARPPRFRTKTDIIRVGRKKGRFEAFRMVVERHDVRFQGIRVVFGNGSEKTVPFYSKIKDGVTTSRFVLSREGRGRFIDRIIVRYNTTVNFKGRAVVRFQGYRR